MYTVIRAFYGSVSHKLHEIGNTGESLYDIHTYSC